MVTRNALLIGLTLVVAALVVALDAGSVAAGPPQMPGVDLVDAWPDVEFKEPVQVTHAGDGSDMLYVVELPGRIQRIQKYRGVGPVPKPSLFLDISSRVYARAQGGLLSLAFHPSFKTNRLFYVSYLAENPTPGPQQRKFKLVVAEYRSQGATADPASHRTVIEIPKKFAQHQAGGIGFGPDGMLYIGIGDGNESKDDADKHAQNSLIYLGKILRIDPSGRWQGRGYAIPRGNPWPNSPNVLPEIWGYGFRNPWRFCWDPRGRMWVTEPGSSGPESREWVIQVVRGGNHGWPYMEGTRTLKPVPAGQTFVPRTFEYIRGSGGSTAGVGGFVYRGDRLKALKGHYVFGDYMRGEVYAIQFEDRPGGRVVGRDYQKLGDVPELASFGEDEQGELYMCANEMGVVFTLAPK